jgi:hypothetical protein
MPDLRAPHLSSANRLAPRAVFAAAGALGLPVVVALATVVWSADAAARPLVVHVRSRTRVEASAALARGRLVVRGRLLDAADAGVADEALRVDIGEGARAARLDVRTDAEGVFTATAPWDAGVSEAALRVTWEGNPAYAPTTFAARLPVARAPVELTLTLQPAAVRSAAPRLGWRVAGRMGGAPLDGIAVTVELDDAAAGRAVADAQGVATGAVAVPRGTPGGAHTLRARAVDAAGTVLGSAVRRWRFAVDARVELGPVAVEPCREAPICLGGRVEAVHGADAAPLPGAIVRLYRAGSDVPIATTRGDGEGRYHFALTASALRSAADTAASVATVLARADGLPGVDPAWSPRLDVPLPPPARVPDAAWAGVLGLMALAVLWRGVLRWRRRRRRDARSARSNAGLPDAPVRLADAAGDPARLSGVLRHGETGRALPATLILRPADGAAGVRERRLVVADGRFAVPGLEPGAWQLTVEAEEHAPLTLTLTIPHDGRFDGCELLPVSHRAEVRQRFADAALRWSGRRVDWRRETPRAAEPRLARSLRRGHRELREAVHAVEEALYGPRTSADVARRADAAVHRLDEGPT